MYSNVGVRLKNNMSMGISTRTKSEGDYTGYAMPPSGDFATEGPSSMRSPWLSARDDPSIGHSSKLHDEITKFMLYMNPTEQEIATRRDLIQRFTRLISSFNMNATVRPVGSCVTGLYLPSSDIDMVLTFDDSIPSRSPVYYKYELSKILYNIRTSGFASKVEDVLAATVPLIRVTDKKTGIEIDLTASDTHGIKATKAVLKWTKEDGDIIRMLVTVVKIFLSIRRCGTTYTGGVNSYVLVWMVVAWVHLEWRGNKGNTSGGSNSASLTAAFDRLSVRPSSSTQRVAVASKHIATTSGKSVSTKTTPTKDFGEILLQFFKFYGTEFDCYTRAIRIEPSPAYTVKIFPYSRYPITQRYLLSIFDPADSSIDMGSKAYGIKHVQASFKEAYDTLADTKRRYGGLVGRSSAGLLGEILGGNFMKFSEKRKGILSARH